MDNLFPNTTFIDDNGQIHLCAEDAAVALINNIDFDSQKHAIMNVFRMIEKSKNENLNDIRKLEIEAKESKGIENTVIVDELVDAYHCSVYFDAANSMSSVGMIAPTLESIMYEAFITIGDKFGIDILNKSSLRKCIVKEKDKEKIWDCHYYIEKNKTSKNLVKGIMQLLEDTELIDFIPTDFNKILEALFSYRNNIFHNGFEWPENIKIKFKKKIDDSNWPVDWFSCSTTDGEPWIYYMTDEFQKRCLNVLDEVYNAVGKYYLRLVAQTTPCDYRV